jgi:putative PEP-CTERM system TPR-repeat lipoprotein
MKKQNCFVISKIVIATTLSLGIIFSSPAYAAREDRGASDEFFQDAKKYLKDGDANAAIIQLKNALQKDRNNIGARKLLGDIYLRVGNGPSAEKELKAAQRRGADGISIQIMLARAYAMQGKFDQILKELKDDVADTAIRADILNLRGKAYFGLGMRQDARASFEEAVKLAPDNAKLKIGLAKVLVAEGNIEKAEALIEASLKANAESVEALVLKGEMSRLQHDLNGALAAFNRALEINKIYISALLGRAATFIDLNQVEQAQPDIQAVFSQSPQHPLAGFLSALILAKKQDFAGAQEMLQQVAPALDDHLPSVYLSGFINYALDQLEQAERQLSRYVAAVPSNIRARKLLGATLVRNKKFQGAIDTLKPLLDANQADAQTLVDLGSAHMKIGKYAEGSELFEQAAKAAPDVSSIRTQLALSRLAIGSSTQAVGDLEAAVDLDPEARQASILLTLVHLRKSQFDKALESAAKLRKIMPGNPMAQNFMGAAYLGKEDLAKARETFEAALKTQSDFHPARMNLAQLDMKEGNVDRAVKHYQQVLEENPKHMGALLAMADVANSQEKPREVVRWLKKAEEVRPTAVEPKLRLVRFYGQQRDIPRALSVARALQKSAPNNPRALEALGRVEITAGQFANAVATFRSLTAVTEKSPRAHHFLGGALVATDNRGAARESFRKAIDLNKSFIPSILALAELEARDGNVDAALKLAAQVKEMRPQSVVGDMLTGDVHMEAQQFDKALASYEKAKNIEDTGRIALRIFNARTRSGRTEIGLQQLQQWVDRKDDVGVRNALASAYIVHGRHEAAIRESEKLLKTQPNNPIVLNNLAWLYDQKGDARAIETGEKALELAPKSPAIMDTVGWIHTRRGDLARGTQMLTNAHRAAPKQGDIAYHLAVALNKSGRKVEARRTLERIFDAQVKFSESANAQKLLRELGG